MRLQHALAGVILFLLAPSSAVADGKAFMRHRDFARWSPASQNQQVAVINFQQGIESMLIAINVDLDSDAEGLWIFPVPGTPEETNVQLVDYLPRFRGEDARRWSKDAIGVFMAAARATQLVPICIDFGPSLGGAGARDFAVHSELEKWGIQAEVVTASDAAGLAAYLRESDKATLDEAELNAFEPYCGDEYVFVVASIASHEELRKEFPDHDRWRKDKRWPCLLVTFVTDKPFYPLLPTASYGERRMSIDLYVLGYVQPECDPALKERLRVSHYEQAEISDKVPAELLAGMPNRDVPYTHVRASVQAREFVDDLRFVPCSPPGLAYGKAVRKVMSQWPIMVVLCFVFTGLLSYICGGLVGLVVFRSWKLPATMALHNLLTLAALVIALRHTKLRRVPGQSELTMASTWQRCVFVLLFMVLFIATTIGVGQLAAWPLHAT